MMETSSMESFLRTRAAAMKGQGLGSAGALLSSPPGGAAGPPRSRRAASVSASMSSSVTATTKTAHRAKAKMLLASPLPTSATRAAMHFQMLTSEFSMSGIASASTTGFAEYGSGPMGGYSLCSSIRRAMQGICMPTPKSAAKARDSTSITKKAPRLPTQQTSSGGLGSGSRAAWPGSLGRPTLSEETVEQTQKTLKQEKPTSSRAAVRMVGASLSWRTRYTSRM
mmetsp:Transcript_102296/g.329847  ORF Transcript_102296/g.329847 Transcript_102296/m.329847 type:complete len:225 (+) Transcript_102296:465-1139(+)